MDYQQSLKNIERLKNFISIVHDDEIYFDFYSQTDYTLKTLNQSEVEKLKKSFYFQNKSDLPFCCVFLHLNDYQIFLYADDNIYYEYNQTTQFFIINDSVKNDFSNINKYQEELSKLQFFRKLKNM